jgi:hypothetical protein
MGTKCPILHAKQDQVYPNGVSHMCLGSLAMPPLKRPSGSVAGSNSQFNDKSFRYHQAMGTLKPSPVRTDRQTDTWDAKPWCGWVGR